MKTIAFIIGTLFFLAMGCSVYSIIGGILFAAMANAESTDR